MNLSQNFFLAWMVSISLVAGSLKYEKRIHQFLRKNYIIDVRPEMSHEEAVIVEFGLAIQGISELNIRKQMLVLNAFTTLKWKDPQLTWNASEYDGIRKCVMASDLIWTPDVVLYNTADDRPLTHTQLYRTKVKINNDGEVSWTAPTTWMVSCPCKVAWFPFDEQVCQLNFGSWTNEKSLLALKMDSRLSGEKDILSGAFLVGSGEWKVTDVKAMLNDKNFACCDDSFSMITVELHLSRMSRYYIIYILFPLYALLLVFALVFHLDLGQRASYGVTILLSITVYLLVISDKLPEKSDELPFLGISFIVDFCILCAFLPLAEYTVRLPLRSSKSPPPWLLNCIDYWCKMHYHNSRGLVYTTSDQHSNYELNEIHEKDNNAYQRNYCSEWNKTHEKDSVCQRNYRKEWRLCGRFLDKVLTMLFLFIQVVFLVMFAVVGCEHV